MLTIISQLKMLYFKQQISILKTKVNVSINNVVKLMILILLIIPVL
jgi:hypothetical protein